LLVLQLDNSSASGSANADSGSPIAQVLTDIQESQRQCQAPSSLGSSSGMACKPLPGRRFFQGALYRLTGFKAAPCGQPGGRGRRSWLLHRRGDNSFGCLLSVCLAQRLSLKCFTLSARRCAVQNMEACLQTWGMGLHQQQKHPFTGRLLPRAQARLAVRR